MSNTVKVNFRYAQNEQGRTFKEKTYVTVQKVVAEYPDGTVRTSTGDVWKVIPCKDKSATYFAIA